MEEVLKHWGLNTVKERNDILLQGSPERSIKRSAFEDDKGRLYVLESVSDFERKRKIAANLQYLNEKGLPVNPYIKHKWKDDFILRNGSNNYQLSKYVEGIELIRPDYLNDKWRGEAMAEFLLQLRGMHPPNDIERPCLREYVRNISLKLNLEEFRDFLEDFFVLNLESSFCHGDFHPLNVIWGNHRINAVIDWEFSGLNYRGYDLCNLLGCVGSEGPKYFDSDFVSGLFSGLGQSYLTREEFENIPALMLAIRFGWLAEWLRKDDKEMVELELVYMSFLKENQSYLLGKFNNFNSKIKG